MTLQLVIKIFKNFESEFDRYEKHGDGLIKRFFKNHNVHSASCKLVQIKGTNHKAIIQNTSELRKKIVLKYDFGNYYLGDYAEGKKQGFGYHLFNNGLVYYGRYKDNLKIDGIVIDPITFNEVYKGEWDHDTYNGRGRLTRRNGQYYEGSFVNGYFQGKGRIVWPNGDRYTGDFEKGIRQGYGKFIFVNGDSYEGEFTNNRYHGKGRYRWRSGDFYDGKFQDGKLTGLGDLKYSIGILGSGVWDNNSHRSVKFMLNSNPPSLQHLGQSKSRSIF